MKTRLLVRYGGSLGRRSLSAARRGFTLLEVMLVLAIIIVLAGIGVGAMMNAQDTASERQAQIKARGYAEACKRFKVDVGFFPSQLEDLLSRPQGVSDRKWRRPYVEKLEMDPWNNPYTLQTDPVNNRVLVVSAGQDGKLGTEDDISSED
ncbi:MAG: type II secretion system major pseudopilin GspG [Pirellulaceae bacterium]|nr:type II secretion system major pseudopilin GspG [Pirellulaceae bacterium]